MNIDSLKKLPSVNDALNTVVAVRLVSEFGRTMVAGWLNEILVEIRADVLSGGAGTGTRDEWIAQIEAALEGRGAELRTMQFERVINATGIVLHTGLGRSPLSGGATYLALRASGACNLEVDLDTGERRYRGFQIAPLLQALTGCEDSLIVNNNAAGTLLCLAALCAGREVIISRGQLVEIGGSFRLPDIFELSGARLREVGTTNRTRTEDYERAVSAETAAIMHVHPSNYSVEGFSGSAPVEELVDVAHRRGVPLIDDIGSGAMRDVTEYGLPAEPTFPASIAAGADVVLGSGDKLLGGPQAGILIGKKELIEQIRKHPLARTVRADKLQLGALAGTLKSYLSGREREEIPLWQMLGASAEELGGRAEHLAEAVGRLTGWRAEVTLEESPVGGGSLPGAKLPGAAVRLARESLNAEELARRLRTGGTRIFPRIRDGQVLIDLRSVPAELDEALLEGIRAVE